MASRHHLLPSEAASSAVLGIVNLSVCLSVRHTRSPHERVIYLVFWYQKRLVGDVHIHFKFVLKVTAPFEKHRLRPISAYNVSTVRASEKCSIIANRKSTTRFPTSCRWSTYITPTRPKRGSKNEFVLFVNKIQVQSNKVCYEFSLCENFQLQSCSKTIPLSNGV